MANASRTPMAGGFLLAIALLVGVIVGAVKGEPSLGFVVGLGIGIAGLVIVWLLDRRKA
ncbi:MAG: hypothetical protein V4808_07280 [Pseudomonadota bacterium]